MTDYLIEEGVIDWFEVERISGYNPNTFESRTTCFLNYFWKRKTERVLRS